MSFEKKQGGKRESRRRFAVLSALCLPLAFTTSCVTNRPNAEVVALQEQAEKGDVVAERTLGETFDFGKHVKRDYVQAAKWYRLAADEGDAHAQNNLASLYANGLGMPTNLTLAVELYRKSAEQNYAVAQNSLGGHYYHGWGVPQDRNQAFRWFKRAAENHNFNAMQNLSNCYRLGIGTASDLTESVQVGGGCRDHSTGKWELERAKRCASVSCSFEKNLTANCGD